MFFSKQNNFNNGNEVNTNTKFYSSANETSMLVVSGWNTNLSVKLHPCTGKDANGVNLFAQNRGEFINTSITQDNAIVLLAGFEKEVEPAIKEGRSGKVSISMGDAQAKKVITILYDGTDAWMEIAMNVDENGVASSENVLKHRFNKRSYMVDYDCTTGSGVEVPVECDLYNFMDKIKGAKDLSPIIAHSVEYSKQLRNSYRSRNNNSFNNPSNNTPEPALQTTESSSDMDFLPFS